MWDQVDTDPADAFAELVDLLGGQCTELTLPASTIGQVLRRWAVPHLADLDRLTGELLRHRVTDERYEHARAGDLLHVDVKKLGRIPPGGGWRLDGERVVRHQQHRDEPVGFDFIHVAVDDFSRRPPSVRRRRRAVRQGRWTSTLERCACSQRTARPRHASAGSGRPATSTTGSCSPAPTATRSRPRR